MTCVITALTRCPFKKTTRETTNPKKAKTNNFKAETQYLNLKAPSNNVKMQSDKTFTTLI